MRKIILALALIGFSTAANASDATDVAACQATPNCALGAIVTTPSVQSGAGLAVRSLDTYRRQRVNVGDGAGNDVSSATPLPVALGAGSNTIGSLIGNNSTLTVAQTVTAASAYATGNAVGGLITLTSINRASGASILVQSVLVTSKSAQTNPMDILLFNASPTGSTCTDKTAVSIVAADAGKLVGVAHVTDWTSGGTASVGQMQQPPIGIAVPATTLYACLVTRSTPTWTSTSDVSVVVSSILN
jgi:hypothetical protein